MKGKVEKQQRNQRNQKLFENINKIDKALARHSRTKKREWRYITKIRSERGAITIDFIDIKDYKGYGLQHANKLYNLD